jgi:hypothetical protein
MHNKSKLLAVAGTTLAVFALSAPAHAQATRTFVSGVGNDADPCSRTAPCKTFAGAISKTFINGEIDCLDPGGFGTLTITKSITIDCTGTLGSVLASGTNGFNINIAVNANDPFRTVRLRGLTINGTGASGTIGTRTGLRGISITQAATVILEDLVISDFSQQGIADARTTTGGKLIIRNSVIRNNTGAGISVGGAATNNASIENVHSINNGFGVATGNGKTPARWCFPIRKFPSTPPELPPQPLRSEITASSAIPQPAPLRHSARLRPITVSNNRTSPPPVRRQARTRGPVLKREASAATRQAQYFSNPIQEIEYV